MKLVRPQGHKCTFRVNSDQARQASLVIDIFPGMPQIFSLHRRGEGVWETELRLPPGEYRFCYHLYDGRSLQYITPNGMETDGLKAVLHVGDTPEANDADDAPTFRPLGHGRLGAYLATPRLSEPTSPAMLRRVAG
ncbi:MAG: hypothetical protein WD534_01070 [Phycisphaeraceae bacterium]